jgi:glycolate oxidase FAD binding subunit
MKMNALHPASIDELRDAIAEAVARGEPLEIRGGGSKRALGRPMRVAGSLCLDRLAGIVSYEPAELVLTARAGTPLSDIEAALAERGQMLAFEPGDWRALLGSDGANATLGGVLACNMAGPRRIKSGAARDHFLGFTAVNGYGEAFKAGGKVVKNVTGYDLCKLMAGSYGTLAVLAEVTIKVLPRPDESATLALLGLDDGAAITALADGLNAPHEVSAAAHLPQAAAARAGVPALAAAGASATVLRLEGPESSVAFRMRALRDLFAARGALVELRDAESERLWREIGGVQPLLPHGDRVVWRVSVPPASGPTVMAALARAMDAAGFYDWGGGLLWLAAASNDGDGGAAAIRAALGGRGHATLIRAPEALRADVPVFEPQSAPLAALTRRVKDSFDPKHILNPGRMYRDA